MDLTGKTALITGATGHIGRGLVPALAEMQINCYCQYFSQTPIAGELNAYLESLNQQQRMIQADLTDPGQIQQMFDQIHKFNEVDFLISLAGDFEKSPIREIKAEEIQRSLKLNLEAPFYLASTLSKAVQNNRNVKILFFSDIAASLYWSGYSVYCAAKAGINAMVRSLAKELAPNITINAIAPGIVEGSIEDPELINKQLKKIPSGRFAKIQEVIDTVVYLLKNDYITGQIINLDGGRSL